MCDYFGSKVNFDWKTQVPGLVQQTSLISHALPNSNCSKLFPYNSSLSNYYSPQSGQYGTNKHISVQPKIHVQCCLHLFDLIFDYSMSSLFSLCSLCYFHNLTLSPWPDDFNFYLNGPFILLYSCAEDAASIMHPHCQ